MSYLNYKGGTPRFIRVGHCDPFICDNLRDSRHLVGGEERVGTNEAGSQ